MLTDGRMFSRIFERGGGVGLYSLVRSVAVSEGDVRKKQACGTEMEMTEPKKVMLAIHFEESRGSRVSAAPDQ